MSHSKRKAGTGALSPYQAAERLGIHVHTLTRIPPRELPYFTFGERGDRRYLPLTKARAELYWRLRNEIRIGGKQVSWPRIGRWLNRDHCTVLQMARRHAQRNGLA